MFDSSDWIPASFLHFLCKRSDRYANRRSPPSVAHGLFEQPRAQRRTTERMGEKEQKEKRMKKEKRADTIQCLITAVRSPRLRTSHHSEAGDSNQRSQASEADALFEKPPGTMTHPTLLFVSLAPRALAWLLKLKSGCEG